MHESMCDTGSVDRTNVSSPWQGLRHGEPQAVPLSVMEGSQKPDPRRWSEMEAKRLKCRRRIGTGKRGIPSCLLGGNSWSKSLLSPRVVVGKAQELEACQPKASGAMVLPTALL